MGAVSRIDISTVLTENYIGGDYFTGYRSVCPVSAGTGALDYMVGRDEQDRLLIACPKNEGETGHVLLNTGFTTTVFDAESGINEDVLVGSAEGRKARIFSVEGQKVARTCEVNLGLADGAAIEKLIAYRRDYVLYLFAVYRTSENGRCKVKIVELLLYDWTYNIISPGFSMDKPVCDCLRNNLSILLIAFDEHNYRYYDFFEEEEGSIPMEYPGELLCFSAVNTPITGEGVIGLFDVGGDRKIYALDLETMKWQNVNIVLNARPVSLETSYYNGTVHLFVSAEAGGETRLYHASRRMDDKAWRTELIMIPISGPITDFAVNKAEEARLGVIYDKAAAHGCKQERQYGFLSNEGTDIEYLTLGKDAQWNVKHAVVDSSKENVYEYPCFHTQITFYDEKSAAWGGLEVELKAECVTDMIVNNRTISLIPDEWTAVTTNMLGRICILQRANELSVPNLTLRAKDGVEKQYAIFQYDKYTKKFETITREDLEHAVLDDGTQLVPEESRGSCDEIARMVRESFAPSNYNYHLFEKDEVIAHNPAGIYCAPRDKDLVFGRICGFSGPGTKIEFLPEGGFRVTRFAGTGQQPGWAATDGLWGSLRDFARSVVNNTVELASMAWEAAKEAVKVTVEFVLDGIKQVASFIIKTVKDMLNSVMAVFDRFKMEFQRLFRWLGQLFNWDDIMETKKQLDRMMESGLLAVGDSFTSAGQGLLKNMGYIIETGGEAKSKADQALPDGFDAEAKSKSIPPDSPFAEGQSGNVILDRMADMTGTPQGMCCTAVFPQGFEDELSTLMDEIMECVAAFGTDVYEAIGKKKDVFMKSFETLEIATVIKSVGAVIEELLTLARTPLGRLMEKLGALIGRLVEKVTALLKTEIKIPFVTTLLKKVFGVPSVSILDVVSTIIAIPCTIVCKLVCGVPPVFSGANGALGNAYGHLKAGYIATGICVSLFYIFEALGAVCKPSRPGPVSILLFSVVPAVTLLIWGVLNNPENDETADLPVTDTIGLVLSVIAVVLCFLVAFADLVSMATDGAADEFDLYDLVNVITALFGLTSVGIGIADLCGAPGQQKWSAMDLISQRNGILTGTADTAIAVSGYFKKSAARGQEAPEEKTDDTVGLPWDKIIAGAGCVIGQAEAACLFAEVTVKPFVKSITPTGSKTPVSGTVKVIFDSDMDTAVEKCGTITIGTTKLAAGTWSGKRTYTANYSGLDPKKEYYLNVEDFQDEKANKMEKDRWTLVTV